MIGMYQAHEQLITIMMFCPITFLGNSCLLCFLNPNDTDVFFDACVPGGGPIGPPLGKSIFRLEKGIFSS